MVGFHLIRGQSHASIGMLFNDVKECKKRGSLRK